MGWMWCISYAIYCAIFPVNCLSIWDGASIHKSEAIRRLLATDRAGDLWLESFPAYAPELNPDEGIWNYLKKVELKNPCCSDLKELRQEILQAVKRLRQKTHIIKACFQQAGLKLYINMIAAITNRK